MEQDDKIQKPISDEPPQQPQPNKDPNCNSHLWSMIIKISVGFVVVAGVVVLIIWACLQPAITVNVEYASLTFFNLSSNTLHHNLSVELGMRNPSKSHRAYYRRVEISAYYDGKWFQRAPLHDFYLPPKNTTVLRAVMAGATPFKLRASGTELYSKQRKAGAFDLDVRLLEKVRYKVGTGKSTKSKTRTVGYSCFLRGLRLGATGGFVRTRCTAY